MKHGAVVGVGSLLLASLLALTVPAAVAGESLPVVQSSPDEYCCVITGIDRHRAVVRVVDEDLWASSAIRRTGQAPRTLRLGQAVSADYTHMEVFAGPACENMPCPIVAVFESTRPSASAIASAHEQGRKRSE